MCTDLNVYLSHSPDTTVTAWGTHSHTSSEGAQIHTHTYTHTYIKRRGTDTCTHIHTHTYTHTHTHTHIHIHTDKGAQILVSARASTVSRGVALTRPPKLQVHCRSRHYPDPCSGAIKRDNVACQKSPTALQKRPMSCHLAKPMPKWLKPAFKSLF